MLPNHSCPACQKLYLEAEAWTRKYEAEVREAAAWKQMAVAQEAERDRLLRLLFSPNEQNP